MTVSEIIADALTDLGVLAAGEVVTAADEATCLRAFKNMMQSMPGFGTGRDLTDVDWRWCFDLKPSCLG